MTFVDFRSRLTLTLIFEINLQLLSLNSYNCFSFSFKSATADRRRTWVQIMHIRSFCYFINPHTSTLCFHHLSYCMYSRKLCLPPAYHSLLVLESIQLILLRGTLEIEVGGLCREHKPTNFGVRVMLNFQGTWKSLTAWKKRWWRTQWKCSHSAYVEMRKNDMN